MSLLGKGLVSIVAAKPILIIFVISVLVISAGCASRPGDFEKVSPPNYGEDYLAIDLPEEYGIFLIHPARGWEIAYDDAQQKCWREIAGSAEFEFCCGSTLNPDQYRVDKLGGWKVLNQWEEQYDGLSSPVLCTYAMKKIKGERLGALQISFNRKFQSKPYYYIVTLRNFHLAEDKRYQEIFKEITYSLNLEFD